MKEVLIKALVIVVGVFFVYGMWVAYSPHWLGSTCHGDICFTNDSVLVYTTTDKPTCEKRGGRLVEKCLGFGCKTPSTQCEVTDPDVCASYGGTVPPRGGMNYLACLKSHLSFRDRLRDAPYHASYYWTVIVRIIKGDKSAWGVFTK